MRSAGVGCSQLFVSINYYCRVFVTGCVASECLIAVRSVIVPGCVGIERLYLFLSFSPLSWFSGIAGPEEAKNLSGGNILRLIRIR